MSAQKKPKAKPAKRKRLKPGPPKRGRPRKEVHVYENENTDVKTWRWPSKPICNANECYAQVKEGEFFCKEHRRVKPNVRDDGVFKPIPLSRLMGRRA